MKKRLKHRLSVTNLGPIKGATVDFRPLTVLVGEQASGKSLLMQLYYFFRSLQTEFALRYKPELSDTSVRENFIRQTLNDLRGVKFHLLANGKAVINYNRKIHYNEKTTNEDWSFEVTEGKDEIFLDNKYINRIETWLRDISESDDYGSNARRIKHIFIPTERGSYSLFSTKEPGVLFAPYQPYPFRRYAHIMNEARNYYSENKYLEHHFDHPASKFTGEIWAKQLEALSGMVTTNPLNDLVWEWMIRLGKEDYKHIPLTAISSGQMEAWPFFAIASTIVAEREDSVLYFEEPETHLHPRAQRIIMETIAYLVEQGREVTITTHSPYLLYTLNNMLLAGQIREKKSNSDLLFSINKLQPIDPLSVAVYRCREGQALNIIDPETGLIDSEELDAIADKLGSDFESALDLLHAN